MATTGGGLRFATIDSLFEDPVAVSFFFVFCAEEHSEENAQFCIAVQQYRDICSGNGAHMPHITQLLQQINFNEAPHEARRQAFKRAAKRAAKPLWQNDAVASTCKIAQQIYDHYCSASSPLQVSLPAPIAAQLEERIGRLVRAGVDLRSACAVFDEASAHVDVSLNSHCLPRFLHSEQYREYARRTTALGTGGGAGGGGAGAGAGPASEDEHVGALSATPTLTTASRAALSRPARDAPACVAAEMLHPRVYAHFLAYLTRRFCAENLLLLLEVQLFDDAAEAAAYAPPTPGSAGSGEQSVAAADSVDRMWLIFHNFLVPGAPWETTVLAAHLAEISVKLAYPPQRGMFSAVEHACLRSLQEQYTAFWASEHCAPLLSAERAPAGASLLGRMWQKISA